ncbi:hypothetical protein T552_00055 [Pneumocystis carinii B80]|uniref:18S rRNA (guanine(1575)-N(7))-methyltransferase Bud23 C-terminal domain-containing protein n=1 Tax=Pneumocystis carinii (strain B80) TaxID=1408658 RepID=A0A0W4ZSR7_PNEC8|nr:hypothetical protein T552_00055 [Pneumocystis carinii B80]KTW31411.1 hypothetical protein T552_00055 [Pneumocystis carinii B80]
MTRPEHQAPPHIYYDETEARKYTSNSRTQMVQAEMTLRSLDLLNLPKKKMCFLMDIGCGSGLSGEILDQDKHIWVGMDISPWMLETALKRDIEGDLMLSDIGHGLPFRGGCFDGAISISVLQWLLYSDTSSSNPYKRIMRLFSTLYSCLARGARAVFQFYPETDQSMSIITSLANKCGFSGGVVIDYPDTKKAKKYYLVLQAGDSANMTIKNIESNQDPILVSHTFKRSKSSKEEKAKIKNTKEWILRKKKKYRKYKDNVPRDSKFTARKRRPKF